MDIQSTIVTLQKLAALAARIRKVAARLDCDATGPERDELREIADEIAPVEPAADETATDETANDGLDAIAEKSARDRLKDYVRDNGPITRRELMDAGFSESELRNDLKSKLFARDKEGRWSEKKSK